MSRIAHARGLAIAVAGYSAGAAWFWLEAGLPRETPAADPATRALIAFLLPTAATVLLWSFHAIGRNPPFRACEPGDDEATARILVRFIAFIGALHGLILLQLTELPFVRAWGPRLAFVLVGALLVSIGNLLPTTRPNALVGIRTLRALGSRPLWIEIHRIGGYLAVALGLVMIGAATMLSHPMAAQVIGVAVIAAVVVVAARYRALVRDSQQA